MMSLRPPSRYSASATAGGAGEGVFSPLDHEIAAEKASSLGRAGEKVERTLRSLRACPAGAPERAERLKEATQAVYAYFIQRELCGLRRHNDAIRDFAIPAEVLARLGAA
jgi:hypothetical protein